MESKQNIAVVSTSSEDMAARIRDINTVHLGAKEYAVATYIAPPVNSARAVAHGIPQGTTDTELMRGLYAHKRHIIQARMLGPCATALITFEGRTVRRYITFDGGELRCLPYRHTVKVCNACHQIGHRTNVCPHPDKQPTCERCGAAEPSDGHDCKLKCSSCDGDHATASKECPKRLLPTPRSSHRPLKEEAHKDNTTTEQPRKVQELRVEIAELRAQLKEERNRNKPAAQESSPEPRTPPQPPQRASTASVVQETVEEMNTEAPPEPNPTAQPIDVRVTACEKGIHENRKAVQELHMRMEKGFDEIRQMITHLHEVFTPLPLKSTAFDLGTARIVHNEKHAANQGDGAADGSGGSEALAVPFPTQLKMRDLALALTAPTAFIAWNRGERRQLRGSAS
ncbi:hypothetical protein HPB49_025598 [Dermacentor silvarum]|uniref:Uncharacterized protein n=1 Tax=Dermacentor silvarum TaxID=543639 RepID=A0ACB8E4L5_DERSI|nr:hypothetical protein HPB49_025598 [Dermacentor silvarum]